MTDWFEKLAGRKVLQVSGEDAGHFLENLVTCTVAGLAQGEARFGALLTPQGKILFDFFLVRKDEAFLLDVASDQAAELLKRLTFYKLRAKVIIETLDTLEVASFSGQVPEGTEFSISDPRHTEMGNRAYGAFAIATNGESYNSLRIRLGIPEGGHDFSYGDAFPHETLMDQYGGVDFKKGCYVGQEVVSRMQHRGTARKRIVKVTGSAPLPSTGTEILADDKLAGHIGSVGENTGLAMLRLDRVHQATHITADKVALMVELPDWVNFDWPEAR